MSQQHKDGKLQRPYRLMRLLATTVHQLQANGEWKIVSEVESVADQFNRMATEQRITLAPTSSPVVTITQNATSDASGNTYVNTTEVLTVAVVSLDDEYDIDVERRAASMRLLNPSAADPPVDKPVAPASGNAPGKRTVVATGTLPTPK